jgi:hypothetical protein
VTVAEPFDRAEERELLRDWFETTRFDKEPPGIPPLAPEDDDE